jgi:hypothetical protein
LRIAVTARERRAGPCVKTEGTVAEGLRLGR